MMELAYIPFTKLIGPTLGASVVDFLTFAVPMAIFVIGGIGNAIYKKKEQDRMRQRSRAGAQGGKRSDSRWQDLAKKRQDELRQAAKRRRELDSSPNQSGGSAQRAGQGRTQASRGSAGRSGSSSSQAGAEPTNLTMAQRIERARAKAEYAARSQSLDSPGHPHGGAHGRAEDEDDLAAREEDRRKAAEAQRRKEESREHELRERREQQAIERRRQQHARQTQVRRGGQRGGQRGGPQQHSNRRSSPQSGSSRSAAGGVQSSRSSGSSRSSHPYAQSNTTPYDRHRGARRGSSAAKQDHDDAWQGGAVHETQIGTGAASPSSWGSKSGGYQGPTGKQLRILLSNRDSIRQAIVTKEVLDKPLALRESNRPGGL